MSPAQGSSSATRVSRRSSKRPVRPLPILTLVAVGVALVAGIVQYAFPGVSHALERTPPFSDSEWWRAATSLLVQTLGWYQVLGNLVTLAVFGTLVEWRLGRAWWLALVIAGTVGGQVAAYGWREAGGGDSIAVCGLAGGLAIELLTQPRSRPDRSQLRPIESLEHTAAYLVALYVAGLTGWGLFSARAALAAVAVAAVGVGSLKAVRVRHVNLAAVGATPPCAFALLISHDLHGAALTAGMGLATLLNFRGTGHRHAD
jgi:membrane associated rhomboid family serine protease